MIVFFVLYILSLWVELWFRIQCSRGVPEFVDSKNVSHPCVDWGQCISRDQSKSIYSECPLRGEKACTLLTIYDSDPGGKLPTLSVCYCHITLEQPPALSDWNPEKSFWESSLFSQWLRCSYHDCDQHLVLWMGYSVGSHSHHGKSEPLCCLWDEIPGWLECPAGGCLGAEL